MLQLVPALQYLGLFWDAYSTPQRGEVPRGEGQGSAPPLPRRCLQLQPPFQSHQMTPLEGSNWATNPRKLEGRCSGCHPKPLHLGDLLRNSCKWLKQKASRWLSPTTLVYHERLCSVEKTGPFLALQRELCPLGVAEGTSEGQGRGAQTFKAWEGNQCSRGRQQHWGCEY